LFKKKKKLVKQTWNDNVFVCVCETNQW